MRTILMLEGQPRLILIAQSITIPRGLRELRLGTASCRELQTTRDLTFAMQNVRHKFMFTPTILTATVLAASIFERVCHIVGYLNMVIGKGVGIPKYLYSAHLLELLPFIVHL